MGFKRTSEGRVFFQNGNEAGSNIPQRSEQTRPAPSAPAVSNSVAKKKDATQLQILSLLKALNDKLADTQVDRKKLQQELETYKMMVVNLQEKTEKQDKESKEIRQELSRKNTDSVKKSKEAEQLTQEAFKEFEEARRLIAEIEERAERTEVLVKKQQIQVREAEEQARIKWDDLKKKSKKEIQDLMVRLDQTEQTQKLLDERIDEANSQTLKLDRKLEKTIQDRSRLIRKLERIEETVLQTHEAMNARAMVLLTDQATAANSGMQHTPAIGGLKQDVPQDVRPENDEMLYTDVPWWRKPMRMQTVSVSLVVIVAALVGWGISEIQKPESFDFGMSDFTAASWQSADNAPVSNEANNGIVPVEEETLDITSNYAFTDIGARDDASVQSEDLLAAEENPAISEFDRIMSEQAAATEQNNDIGAIDLNNEEQLLALLEDNPDALAAQLNNIEPSSIPPSIAAEEPVAQLEKQREAIIELNKDAALPSKLDGTIYDRIKADKNLPKTVKEIETAAFSGNAEAQHDLAAIYIAGHGGVSQDYGRASLWFEEAAHNGIANARYNLGVLYHQGIGVKQDTDKAFEWYKAAAALGHPEAQYNLGIAYIEGIGVPYDPLKAAAYFENAANSGVMEAAYNLGLIYENGLLGKAQPDTALLWYKRASDQGSPEAKAALEQLAKTMGMSISDVNQLIDGMDKVSDSGAATAQKKTEKLSALKQDEMVVNPAPTAVKQEVNIVALVQQELMSLGLYPGPADGVEGAITRDAVRAYQSRNNLTVNGEIDDTLLNHMQFDNIGEGKTEQGSSER